MPLINYDIQPVLNWVIEPDPDKVKSYKIKVLSKNDSEVMDRLWITVVSRSTKTAFDTWESTNQNLDWLAELPSLYSSLEEKEQKTVVVPSLPLPTTVTVWRIPQPDRNCATKMWEEVDEHPDPGYYYHPSAYFEIRSEKTPNGHGHQACYDSDRNLIRNGVSAGTADKSHPSNLTGPDSHKEQDVMPFVRALQLDGNPVEALPLPINLKSPIVYEGSYVGKYIQLRPTIIDQKPELVPGTCPQP